MLPAPAFPLRELPSPWTAFLPPNAFAPGYPSVPTVPTPHHHPPTHSSTSPHCLQSQAAFQELILDLQEAVLAEAAALLRESAYSDLPAPAAQRAEAQLPTPFRTAGTVLKVCRKARALWPGGRGIVVGDACLHESSFFVPRSSLIQQRGLALRSPATGAGFSWHLPATQGHTVGVLNTGQAHNAEGLDRHALPAHLPPALASSPFNWVRVRRHHAPPALLVSYPLPATNCISRGRHNARS